MAGPVRYDAAAIDRGRQDKCQQDSQADGDQDGLRPIEDADDQNDAGEVDPIPQRFECVSHYRPARANAMPGSPPPGLFRAYLYQDWPPLDLQ